MYKNPFKLGKLLYYPAFVRMLFKTDAFMMLSSLDSTEKKIQQTIREPRPLIMHDHILTSDREPTSLPKSQHPLAKSLPSPKS
ncbi:hypothetical protein CEXT_514721 [Caerostris extrusa]|uniref:Uncharacterized protein n=1 Tax=Caerostris extrusa TaxID=172846 RepID=A0AAV4Y7F6_CAEEX|nr:hypothetical protein CEXT_514721 [Caerostris extrusa]